MKDQKSNPDIKRKKVSFVADFPGAAQVLLVGEFNNWDPAKHPMKIGDDGIWRKSLFLYPGTYEYKFVVDGEWRNDPENPLICANSFGTRNNFILV
jgi:1,4-alpha-glucan branching enzyme